MIKCGKVFMLDDDKFRLDMYATFLRKYGIDVFATDNTYKMILYAKEINPNVIVLDVNMVHGWQILEYIRSKEMLKNIPIVMFADVKDVSKLITMGISNFLLKPVEPIKLLEMITAYCNMVDNYDVLWLDKMKNVLPKEVFIK